MSGHEHPTAVKLLDTVSTMLDGEKPNEIYVDEVLAASGVSRGSLYHHFGDYPSLVRATLIRRFSANVDADSAAMLAVAQSATTQSEFWDKMRAISVASQSPDRAPARRERSRLISLARIDDDFAIALAAEQDRLTHALSKSVSLAQQKGWVASDLSPFAIAVFIQAYSLGRGIDDIAGEHVPNDEWMDVVDRFLRAMQPAS